MAPKSIRRIPVSTVAQEDTIGVGYARLANGVASEIQFLRLQDGKASHQPKRSS